MRHMVVVETIKSHVIVIVENDDPVKARLQAHHKVKGKASEKVALSETSIPLVIDLTITQDSVK